MILLTLSINVLPILDWDEIFYIYYRRINLKKMAQFNFYKMVYEITVMG